MPLFVNSTPFSPEDFLNKLIPNFWSLLINLLALIVFFVVLYFIAYKPVKKLIKARRHKVQEEMQEGERLKKIGEEREKETRNIVSEAKAEASLIRQKGEEEGVKLKEEMLQKAETELKEKKARALEELRQEEEKTRAALQSETVDLALLMAEKLVDEKMDSNLDKKLVASFAKDLGEKKDE